VGTVTALNGTTISMTNGKSIIILDTNDRSGKVVRVASPYPNHNSMKGRSYIEVLSSLLTAGWKEIQRRKWDELYLQRMHKEKLPQRTDTDTKT